MNNKLKPVIFYTIGSMIGLLALFSYISFFQSVDLKKAGDIFFKVGYVIGYLSIPLLLTALTIFLFIKAKNAGRIKKNTRYF
ncbi:hypothetical protein [Pedobacter metabolipauper]|uniref:Uncharacterized protein n=1 Tax=Pedobacter metabolipauper TaxID=425513 RepID=A0A4R6SZM9_9SPHI|nr:hypothetical protein [Pedobacter metabolipauper]TDQ11916.1 hypothetical protein ATK78_1046 [Pedobacter metabolipauper]